TQKVAVHLVMVAVEDSPQLTVPLARDCVTADAAMRAQGRRRPQIPFACVVFLQCLVREDPGRTHLDQIAAEFVLQNPVLVASEVDVIARREDIQIAPASVIAVITDAAIALDAAIHLVIYEWP